MLETRLHQWLPRPWSVKNQARMHLRGGRAPYRDSEEAISFWTEVETAIGARLNADDSITLVAPRARGAVRRHHHLQRENGDRAAYAQRVLDKGWLQRWPHLRQVKI